MKKLILMAMVFLVFSGQVFADQITIINSALNGGSYPWDTCRGNINNNFDDLYAHWTLITVTTEVDLDSMDALIDANVLQVSEFVTLSGVAAHSTDLGTFTGSTIPDFSDNKEAFQALETAVEAAAPGVDENYVTDAELLVLQNTSGTNSGDVTMGTANGLSLVGQVLSLAAATNGNAGAMTAALVTNLESLITLSGVLADATDFGTFTGVTIPDGSTNKEALQALETAVEAGGGAFDPASPGEIGGTTPDIVNATQLVIPFVDGAADTGWLDFNSSYTPPTGFNGITPYIDNLYKVLNGSILGVLASIDDTAGTGDTTVTLSADEIVSRIAAGGGGVSITEVASEPNVNDMTPSTLYVNQDDGGLSYLLADSSVVNRYNATTSTGLFLLTLTDPGSNDYIQSTDGFLDCGNGATDCTYLYASGATPELTATADTGRQYDNWTGDATQTSTTTNPDTILMDAAKGVSADFSAVIAGFFEGFEAVPDNTWTEDTDSGVGGTIDMSAVHSGTLACTDKGIGAFDLQTHATTDGDCFASTPVTFNLDTDYYIDIRINTISSGGLTSAGNSMAVVNTDDVEDPAFNVASRLMLVNTGTGVAYRLLNSSTTVGTTPDITLNTWEWITMRIRNNTAGDDEVQLFQDGVSIANKTDATFLNAPAFLTLGKTSALAIERGVHVQIDIVGITTTLPADCPQ